MSTLDKRRVLLVCSETLFGESLEILLRNAEDVELVGPLNFNDATHDRILLAAPDVVIIAEEPPEHDVMNTLTAALMERFPNLHVIKAGLEQNTLRVFAAQTWPASSVDLISVIRGIPAETNR